MMAGKAVSIVFAALCFFISISLWTFLTQHDQSALSQTSRIRRLDATSTDAISTKHSSVRQTDASIADKPLEFLDLEKHGHQHMNPDNLNNANTGKDTNSEPISVSEHKETLESSKESPHINAVNSSTSVGVAHQSGLDLLPLDIIDKHQPMKGTDKPIEFLDLNKHGHQHQNNKIPLSIVSSKATTSKAINSVPISAPASKSTSKDEVELHELGFTNHHPIYSPRKGTDIDPPHQLAVLLCPNQSKCIVPELQLQIKVKVYLCKHPTRQGVRFYFLAREGLLLHPNVQLLDEKEMHSADYVVYLPGSSPWQKTECTDPSLGPKMLVLDEFDGHSLISPSVTTEEYVHRYGGRAKPWYYMYFKRSFVRRTDGVFLSYPHKTQYDVFPMTYGIAEAYVPHQFNAKREIEILCTLRGHKTMQTRQRVQDWVAQYGQEKDIKNMVTSQVTTASRTTVSKLYFEQMYNSKIIVTVNPANWEGDFRLWEAMCTGALVFVDHLYVPHQYPLVGDRHVIFFDNHNRSDLFAKLDYYRSNPLRAREIAVNGYLHAMKFHRTVNIIDYVLRSAHYKRALLDKTPLPNYAYTAQYLNAEAIAQEKTMIHCRSPGLFDHSPVPVGNSSEPYRNAHRIDCAGATAHSGLIRNFFGLTQK